MRLNVVLHTHAYTEVGQFSSNPLNDLLLHEVHNRLPANDATSVIKTCNNTHSIRYMYFGNENSKSPNTINVYRFYAGHSKIPNVKNKSHINLLFTLEPPAHLPFSYIPRHRGYSGIVSYRKTDTIYRPIVNINFPILSFTPKRNTIGMWVDNCAPTHRKRIMEDLLASKSNVVSMGHCLRNSNKEGLRLHTGGFNICNNHRIMLAIENNVCSGFISPNFQNALNCGAIPIVYSIKNVPKYPSNIPLINAAKPNWLSLVIRIMKNDTFYRNFLTSHSHKYKERKYENFHCQWFNLRKKEKNISWPKCYY